MDDTAVCTHEVQPGAVEGHREIALAGQVEGLRVLAAQTVRESIASIAAADARRRPRAPLAAMLMKLHLGPLATDPSQGEVEVGDGGKPEADAGPQSAGHDRLPCRSRRGGLPIAEAQRLASDLASWSGIWCSRALRGPRMEIEDTWETV